ncbi:MAG: hypothetical protein WCH40_07015, partial [Verrucomicrobiales bacterium]
PPAPPRPNPSTSIVPFAASPKFEGQSSKFQQREARSTKSEIRNEELATFYHFDVQCWTFDVLLPLP